MGDVNHNSNAGTHRWADRTDFGDGANGLAVAIADARAASRPLIDLTVTNPTRCGFVYDMAALLAAFAVPTALQYQADPLGAPGARQAIADQYYGQRDISISPDRIVLTASTSEAYGYLLRLLCNPGDEFLVPEPSYPLFDLLASMQDVTLVRYPLRLHDGWRVDWEALRACISQRTRAIVVVHPNNPTGHTAEIAEQAMFQAVAAEFKLALIVDEVFLDYPIHDAGPLRSFAGPANVLTFVLSGLSKVLALPQMKLAWTAVCGPESEVEEAVHRLQFIADTFLSVNGPVQMALGSWLPLGADIQQQIRRRVSANLERLDVLLAGSVCSRLPVWAGWSVMVRVPAVMPDQDLAVLLVEHCGVVVHPGSFYGMAAQGWLVLSLIVQQEEFDLGVTRLITGVDRVCNVEPCL